MNETTRVRFTTEDDPRYRPGFWSAVTGRWIVQGEHRTEEAARRDQQNW